MFIKWLKGNTAYKLMYFTDNINFYGLGKGSNPHK